MSDRNDFKFNIPSGGNNSNPWMSILVGIFFLVALYFIARFIFRILYFLSPLFLIAALILDYKVVVNYGKWIVNLYKQNTLMGVGATLLTVFGFPLVSAFLAGRAFYNRRIKQVEQSYERHTKGEMVDFEELDSEPLQLPELDEDVRSEKKDSDYENMF